MAQRGVKPKLTGSTDASTWKVPTHLSKEAKREYKRLVAVLEGRGTLGETDPTLIEVYSINADLLRRAMADVERLGTVYSNSVGNLVANPACAIVNSASQRLKTIISDLGLCPNNSKGISDSEDVENDKWENLL